MWKNREYGKQILRACAGTGRAEKVGESGKKYGLLQLYMGILLLLVVSVSGNVPYSGVNREKISLYGSKAETRIQAEQEDKREDPAAVQSAVEPEPLNLNSRSAVLMDADTGRVLYGKNETEDLPMASTTKIMTCILALENAGPETEVLVSDRAASMPEVKLHIKKGEKYRMEDLLYSLMLESHNDSAVAIAEAVAGSVEKFADMMNRKAVELGCGDTCFVTPNGLDAEDAESGKIHSTTAEDLARILRYCILFSPAKNEFLAITRAPSHAFSDLSGMRTFSCVNHNALLTSMEGAVSGKTGFTGKAGYCYVGAVKKGEKFFIMALLGCGWPPHKTYKWQDVRKLVQYGETNFEYRVIEKTGLDGEPVIAVKDGVEPEVKVRAENGDETSIRILLGKDEDVRVRTKVAGTIQAPVREGTPVGQRDYMIGDVIVASDPVLTTENVEVWDFGYAERIVMKKFWQL